MKSHSDWNIVETEIPTDESAIGTKETLFSLANGHIGMRGDFEEPGPAFQRGTYMNGFFESEPIAYGETAFGYAKNHQTMLNLPDARVIRLFVDGQEFSLAAEGLSSYRRELDIQHGVLRRELTWTSASGYRVDLSTKRLVSFSRPEIAAISYSFRVSEHKRRPKAAADGGHQSGEGAAIRLVSELNLGSRNLKAGSDPRVGSKLASDAISELASRSGLARAKGDMEAAISLALMRTSHSALSVACGCVTMLRGPTRISFTREGERLLQTFDFQAPAGEEFTVEKFMIYRGPLSEIRDSERSPVLFEALEKELLDCARSGFATLEREQSEYLASFWTAADVEVEGDESIQQALRFNLFHMLQSAGRDGKSNLAAKGLSGEGYEGHYFWDTEIYAMPLFTFIDPSIARGLLDYRYGILPRARERAAELGHKGALFPWRTIDGTEASAYYPAGTAQYHIDADIIYAARRYAICAQDESLLCGPLAEMAVETARFWLSLGAYIDRDGGRFFCINDVTGPDEYTAIVNNNVYTNLMAKTNLDFAARLVIWMKAKRPSEFRALGKSCGLDASEADSWQKAADSMFIPYDEKRRLFPQDDSFFNKAPWDFVGTPKNKYPLLLHFHPLNIYRHQVLKQPDLVLAMLLQGDYFDAEQKKLNFDFYEALTTGDSSLSHCIQSVMAAETGDVEKAWRYFQKTVRMDLDDLHGNARDGIHAAAMAGSWLSTVYGFAGFRDHIRPRAYDSADMPFLLTWSFKPALPEALSRVRFQLKLGKSVLKIDISREPKGPGKHDKSRTIGTSYELASGPALEFMHDGKLVRLEAEGQSLRIPGRSEDE